jgi:hypothetical protein
MNCDMDGNKPHGTKVFYATDTLGFLKPFQLVSLYNTSDVLQHLFKAGKTEARLFTTLLIYRINRMNVFRHLLPVSSSNF